jgi:hypothetical protein
MSSDPIFPATWFVLGYLALLILMVGLAAYWARTHGQLDQSEKIRWKVFDDGVPDPQSESGFQSRRPAR